MSADELPKVVLMPPKNTRLVRMRISEVRKAEPLPVAPEEPAIYPVAYCPQCERLQLIMLDTLEHRNGRTADMASCAGCEQVLDLGRELEFEWLTADEVREQTGWVEKEGEDR